MAHLLFFYRLQASPKYVRSEQDRFELLERFATVSMRIGANRRCLYHQDRLVLSRMLCRSCYNKYHTMVQNRETTWEQLEQRKLVGLKQSAVLMRQLREAQRRARLAGHSAGRVLTRRRR